MNSGKIMKTKTESGVPLFTPLRKERTYRVIAKRIRQMIDSRALNPGDRLPSESELAAQFGAGRLSVREALRMLEQAGLIEVKQGSAGGSYIREPDVTVTAESLSDLMRRSDISLRHLTDARLAIEKLVLNRAFDSISDDHLLALEKCVKELKVL